MSEEKKDIGKIMEEMLNRPLELIEENKKLKKKIEKLQKENKESKELYDKLFNGYNKLVQEYLELEKENAELKEELDYYKQKENQVFDERDYYEE